ncbi:MAG: response regulator [Magnetococcales bacterium]|nr:response regulator [Magnetococcales bacterium]MBF0116012.1 response regulator [Magnetococcales bacterium]
MKILIVDDVEENRIILNQQLLPYGKCYLAANGVEALVCVKDALSTDTPFDLILLDVMMPIMDGLSTLQAIRSEEHVFGRVGNKESVIIMVTACSEAEVVSKAFFKGYCTDFLTKPIRRKSLVDKLKEYHLITESDRDDALLVSDVKVPHRTKDDIRLDFYNKLFGKLADVGIPAFNEAHKALLKMVVDIDEILWDAIEANLPPSDSEWHVMSEIFSDLVSYTKIHFSAELAYLYEHGYPMAGQHAERHGELVNELNEYNKKIVAMNPDSVRHIRRWLLEWLLNHVNQQDLDYSMFFSEQNRKSKI